MTSYTTTNIANNVKLIYCRSFDVYSLFCNNTCVATYARTDREYYSIIWHHPRKKYWGWIATAHKGVFELTHQSDLVALRLEATIDYMIERLDKLRAIRIQQRSIHDDEWINVEQTNPIIREQGVLFDNYSEYEESHREAEKRMERDKERLARVLQGRQTSNLNPHDNYPAWLVNMKGGKQ